MLTECILANNMASHGGAIAIYSNAKLSCNGCSLINNAAKMGGSGGTGGGLYISVDFAGYPVEYACDAGYDLRGPKVADCEVNGNYQMPVRSRFSPYSVPLIQLMLVCPYRRAKRLHAGRLLLTMVASGIVTK